jgi:uncharacterized protein
VKVKLAALVLGVPFGFTLAWTGLNDPDTIRRMMLLQSAYVYEMFALAVAVGLAGSLVLRRLRPRALVTGEPVEWETSRPERRHVAGSLIFGAGWAISASCPGPIATQLSSGLWWSGFTIAGIAGGILVYFARQDWLARRAAGLEAAPAELSAG